MVGDLAERRLEIGPQPAFGMAQHQVLERIEGVLGDRPHVRVVREEERQLLLEHQHAGRDRGQDVVAGGDHRRERRDVRLLELRDRVEVAELELRHAAAALLRARARPGCRCARAPRRGPRRCPARCGCRSRSRIRRRGRVVPAAGTASSAGFARRASRVRNCGAWNSGSGASRCTPSAPSSSAPAEPGCGSPHSRSRARPGCPRCGRRRRSTTAGGRGTARPPAVAHRLRAQHQVREVHVPRVRRNVGTLAHVAHVAEVAVIHHLPARRLRHGRDFAGRRFVDVLEQDRETRCTG